jgi:chemotaxis protein CheZ
MLRISATSPRAIVSRNWQIKGSGHVSHKLFKIERKFNEQGSSRVDSAVPPHHNQMMDALAEIKDMLAQRSIATQIPEEILAAFRTDMAEAAKIKAQLDTIQMAIDRTKTEIAALHLPGEQTPDIPRMTDELGAIVNGTEQATEKILAAVERIDEDSHDLFASVRTKNQRDAVADIQEQVVRIYEACNFQDLTGQRISKVIRAFSFIEKRVAQMMDIWGGIESFKGFEPIAIVHTQTDGHLLNGPALAHDENVVSQDEIDALFD